MESSGLLHNLWGRTLSAVLCRYLCLVVLCVGTGSTVTNTSFAQATSEYEVKAAFILNFAKFTEWMNRPSQLEKTLPICLWRDNPFGSIIEKLNGRTVGERVISVQTIDTGNQIPGCGILFVSGQRVSELAPIKKIIYSAQVMTITETPLAGAINFVPQEDRVRFDCNLIEAESMGIKLSSQLLKLALEVKER